MRTVPALILGASLCICSVVLAGFYMPVATAQSSPSSSGDENPMKQQIVAKEREGLDALKTGRVTRFGDLTADDAVFVDASGPAGKAQVLKNVAGFKILDYSMGSVEFRALSTNTGLIVYKITEKGISHDKEFSAQVYVSSIWTQQNGKWVCRFSQETAAR